MVFYIVDFAARIRRRSLGSAARLEEGDRAAFSAKSDLIWMHYFEDVVRTAEALERGEDLAEALART
jgi:hypothetical protein